MPTSHIVVPCYNEQHRLDTEAFLHFAANHPDVAFLFVNDGSTDDTAAILDSVASTRIRVLHLEKNQGKAEAVRQGLLELIRSKAPFGGYWDADLATPLDAIPEFTALLDHHPRVEMVYGSRVQLLGRHIRRRALRHYLGRLFATVVSWVLGVPIYDTQCGAKLFRLTPAVARVFESPFRSRWIFDVEILTRYLRAEGRADAGDRVHELPLRRWTDVAGSKLRPGSFLRAAFELFHIARKYRRPAKP